MPLSSDELRSAWERVAENAGCAGADGETIERFAARLDERLQSLAGRLQEGFWRPLPFLLIEVEKPGGGGVRRLLVPAVRDRVVLTALARRVSLSAEDELLEATFAYRPGRGVDSAIARILQWRDRGFIYVVDADITGFFDNVDHSLLLGLLGQDRVESDLLPLLDSAVRAAWWDGSRIRRLAKGIPQGSPLSPVLANLFLAGFDALISQSGNHLVRYADDFLILCETEARAKDALESARQWLASQRLELKDSKTRLTSFREGFQFLGVRFIEDEVLIPWKGGRPKGRILRAAPAMGRARIEAWERPPSKTAVSEALQRAGLNAGAAASRAAVNPKTRRTNLAYLYITEQGAVVRKSGDRFLVEKEDRVLADLPYHKLESVLVFGHIQITAQALGELMDKGILASFFTRQGRLRGSIAIPHGRDIFLRLAQFDLFRDADRSLGAARAIVNAKLRNGLAVLNHYAKESRAPGAIEEPQRQISEAISQLDTAQTLGSLMGLEGAGAKAYFQGLRRFNRSRMEWTSRVHHPATDPVNALLSLGYTLVGQELGATLEGHGLDPYLGLYHQPDYGRRSLALDLLEAFRHPVVDRLIWTLINRLVFTAADFVRHGQNGGMYLQPPKLKDFLQYYERWMLAAPNRPSFRELLRREVGEFVRMLKKEAEYTPFLWEESADPREEELWTSLSATI